MRLCVAVVRSHPVVRKYGTTKCGLTAYVLTQEELIHGRYPMKGDWLPAPTSFIIHVFTL